MQCKAKKIMYLIKIWRKKTYKCDDTTKYQYVYRISYLLCICSGVYDVVVEESHSASRSCGGPAKETEQHEQLWTENMVKILRTQITQLMLRNVVQTLRVCKLTMLSTNRSWTQNSEWRWTDQKGFEEPKWRLDIRDIRHPRLKWSTNLLPHKMRQNWSQTGDLSSLADPAAVFFRGLSLSTRS